MERSLQAPPTPEGLSAIQKHFAEPPVKFTKIKIKVHVPDELEATLKNHIFDARRTPAGELMGYVEIPYEHQEYPKMLYHPEWGAKPQPDINSFVKAAKTAQEYEMAATLYQQAVAKWARGNRTKIVEDAKQEASLVKKGWLLKPPTHKGDPTFDMNSDEI